MKAICIDDEQLALDYLERQIGKVSHIEVIGKHLNPLKGKKHVLNEEVDIVFLDIQMPEVHGIELAEQIIQEKPDVIVVFVTAYNEFAVDAFELNAIDYLIKPIKLDRLKNTIQRIEKQLVIQEKRKPQPDLFRVKVSNYLSFEVERNIYKTISWRTAKTQELFLYLLQNKGTLVEKTKLIELLWGEFDLERGFARLYTTIYNVRKTLRQFGNHFVLHNKTDGYLLELKDVKIDLYEWETQVANLPSLNDSSVNHYVEVANQNKEPYLLLHDYTWAESERYRLEMIWQRLVKKVAIYFIESKKLEQAITCYKKICKRHPEDEESHFALMRLFHKTGRDSQVIQQYDKLHKIMEDTVSVAPSGYIKNWIETYYK